MIDVASQRRSTARASAQPGPVAPERRLTVGEILRTLRPEDLMRDGVVPSRAQQKVLRRLSDCRTAAYGGHVDRCNRCAYEHYSYSSCGDRHCPNCLSLESARWLKARKKELLPVGYFHVVFTVPKQVSDFALSNKKAVYEILFAAASETLQEVARRRLGAEIGFLAVLHSWNQVMLDHSHVHCVVPGGGLSLDGKRWISCRSKFLLPIRVLQQVFRAKFLAKLKNADVERRLRFRGKFARLAEPTAFAGWLGELRQKRWNVYAKPPFGSPEKVLNYLSRYTHKVCISNWRLVSFENGQVTFRYRDRKLGNVQRQMTLDVREFARRFLLHVVPKGMQRIRHYGFLANACRKKKLALCRTLLSVAPAPALEVLPEVPLGEVLGDVAFPAGDLDLAAGDLARRCPACQLGVLRRDLIPPRLRLVAPLPEDTS